MVYTRACIKLYICVYVCIYIYIFCYVRVPSEFHRHGRCSFSGRWDRHRADTTGKLVVYRCTLDGDDCRWRGATLPRSVTVGNRLAQKSDRHRPLSLRPVSLRRRIYMQFLLIVLLCHDGFGGGDPASPPHPTPLIPRTVTTGRV